MSVSEEHKASVLAELKKAYPDVHEVRGRLFFCYSGDDSHAT